jgi:hypothetical protein
MSELLNEYVHKIALLRVEREEQMVRAALVDWLPSWLGWLVDRPRLLRLYLRFPHRHRIYLERQQRSLGPSRVVIR